MNSGTATSTVSAAVTPSTSSTATAVATRFRCDSRTPLGFPIVPEVYRMASVAPASRAAGGSSGRAPRDQVPVWEHPVVVPVVPAAHGDEVLHVGEVADQLVEQLDVVAAPVALGGDENRRLGVPELVRQLVRAQAGIDRHQDRAEPRRRQRGGEPLRPVGQIDRDGVAGLDPEVGEGPGERLGLVVHLRVGGAALAGHHARPLRIPRRGGLEDVRQMSRRQKRASNHAQQSIILRATETGQFDLGPHA